jgi:sugar-specific transcriptional regulator TrmB
MLSHSEKALRKLMNGFMLSKYEAEVYLSLVKREPLTVAEISRLSMVPRSRCYDVLRSLEAKGLVSSTSSRPLRYQALPVRVAIENRVNQLVKEFNDRRMMIEDIGRELEMMSRDGGRRIEAQFLEGKVSFQSLMLDVLNAKDEVLIAKSKSPAMLEEHCCRVIDVLKRGVKIRLLVHSIQLFMDRVLEKDELKKYLNSQLQIGSTDLVQQPFSIIDEEITYIFFTDVARREILFAIRVEDRVFAKQMKTMFELLWGRSRRLIMQY